MKTHYEVELRARINATKDLYEIIKQEQDIKYEVNAFVKDSYIIYDIKNKNLHRLREALVNNSINKYYEMKKTSIPSLNHMEESGKILTREEYLIKYKEYEMDNGFIGHVIGSRKEINLNLKQDKPYNLTICLDKIFNLGSFVEFEIKVYDKLLIPNAEEQIKNFAAKLGIYKSTDKNYPDMLFRRERGRGINAIPQNIF